MTLISIIIPAYNASLTIRDTIKSILSQSYKDFELIIILLIVSAFLIHQVAALFGFVIWFIYQHFKFNKEMSFNIVNFY